MKLKPKSVEEYIHIFPDDIQQRLNQIRNIFRNAIPGVEETIRYDIPAFKVGKAHLYIAAYKKHIGMYPIYGMEELENEIIPYRGKNTKDAIHFPHSSPIPFQLIEIIIEQKSKQH